MITAYTYPYPTVVDRILVNCFVSTPDEGAEEKKVRALWDTGAVITCISESLAEEFGFRKTDEKDVVGADNIPFKANVYCVSLRMGEFRIGITEVVGLPMDGNEHKMIIGMDIISRGDLSITNYNGRTVLTFREPSIQTIDYVAELNLQNKCDKMHAINLAKHLPDKCACGSNKDYKNCHGKSPYHLG